LSESLNIWSVFAEEVAKYAQTKNDQTKHLITLLEQERASVDDDSEIERIKREMQQAASAHAESTASFERTLEEKDNEIDTLTDRIDELEVENRDKGKYKHLFEGREIEVKNLLAKV
jgi:uncharacterized protein HemX